MSFPRLRFVGLYQAVKEELTSALGRNIDLADKNALNEIGRRYILPGIRYVDMGEVQKIARTRISRLRAEVLRCPAGGQVR